MKCYVGVDLGSTTSKAVVLGSDGEIIGRGITNSRSNYDVAVDIARSEAFIEARFNLLGGRLRRIPELSGLADRIVGALDKELRVSQYTFQLDCLEEALLDVADPAAEHGVLKDVVASMREAIPGHFRFNRRKTGFFRDLATSDYMGRAQDISKSGGPSFDRMANLFDKSIIQVENRGLDLSFEANIGGPMEIVIKRFADRVGEGVATMRQALESAVAEDLEVASSVGTGYGRARLPFDKDCIRSEILCHGLGAHRMFPETRTVLDIGGQDTKAIQVDGDGIVTSFQMNDRCAAGCGRYLGYIADEMNLGVHELGPLASSSDRPTRINSTCTVFAGAELRDRLTMGQKREDILAGLHRAIILRAMSLLARSGGVKDELTFTGGVANNAAAVSALETLVHENYGEVTLNISPDSIYTGALGAATFAQRGDEFEEVAA